MSRPNPRHSRSGGRGRRGISCPLDRDRLGSPPENDGRDLLVQLALVHAVEANQAGHRRERPRHDERVADPGSERGWLDLVDVDDRQERRARGRSWSARPGSTPDQAVIDGPIGRADVDGPAFDERAIGPGPKSRCRPQRLHVAGSAQSAKTAAGSTSASRTLSMLQLTSIRPPYEAGPRARRPRSRQRTGGRRACTGAKNRIPYSASARECHMNETTTSSCSSRAEPEAPVRSAHQSAEAVLRCRSRRRAPQWAASPTCHRQTGSDGRSVEALGDQPDRQDHLLQEDGKSQDDLGRRHRLGETEHDEEADTMSNAMATRPQADSHRGTSRD